VAAPASGHYRKAEPAPVGPRHHSKQVCICRCCYNPRAEPRNPYHQAQPSTSLPIAPPVTPLVRRRPSRVFRAVTAARIAPDKAVARIRGDSADGTPELQTRGTSPIRCVAHRQARQELDIVIAWGIDPRISGIRCGPRDGRCGRFCRSGGDRIGTTRNEDATQPVTVGGVTVRASGDVGVVIPATCLGEQRGGEGLER
jgi:hypothetical protein